MHTLNYFTFPQLSMPSGPIRLGQLLSSAYSFSQSHLRTIMFAALVFGTVSALLMGSVQHKAGTGFGTMMQDMGIDVEKMEDLSVRMQAGDESAAAEMEALVEARFGDMTDDEQGSMMVGMVRKTLGYAAPYIGLSVLVGLILAVASGAFFLVMALGAQKEAPVIFGKVPGLFFPLLGVWIWSFLRSFAWIPFLGIIPAIILGPRFVLAPVILVKEKKGVMDSVRESYVGTTGYWGKIVGNMIVAGLCAWLAGVVVAIIAGILGSAISPWVALWVTSVTKYVFMAYMTVFGVQLALTIMANPLVVSAKKK